MPRVYIPCTLQVQLAGTEENPNGSIVTFNEGWAELSDDLMQNAVLKHLAPQSEAAGARAEKLFEAQQTRDKAVAEADAALTKAREEAAKEAEEELTKANEEYAKKAEEAAAKGQVYTEPHPDPAVQSAVTMTSQSAPVTANSMATKPADGGGSSRPKLEDTPPPRE